MITTITNPLYKVVSKHPVAEVWLNTSSNQYSLHAVVAFKKGEVITNFYAGTTQPVASYLTIQTATGKHITLLPEFLQYTNHSCSPNVFFDTATMQLICISDLRSGDELRFFYPSTEWEMSQPFICNCGSDDCLQLINGASFLSKATLKKYRLNDFILQQIKQKEEPL